MKISRILALFLISMSAAGCSALSPTFVEVRPLNEVIIQAAEEAKKANASNVSIEVAVTNAFTGTAGGTIKVVEISAEASHERSTTVTAEIANLSVWTNPNAAPTATEKPLPKLEMNVKTREVFQNINGLRQPLQ